MALFKRGEVWWMRFTYQGRQVRRSTETPDEKLAQRIYDKVRGQIAEGKWFEREPGEEISVNKLLDRYLADHSKPNKAATTARRDKSLAAHLRKHFGHLMLTQVRPSVITEYKSHRRKKGASPKTINSELTLLSHAYTLAMREWEWVAQNPVQRVSREKVRNYLERWLTVEEEERLLAASPPWLQEIIVFAINTGLRQSEILNLQWPLVDLFRRTITLLEQKNGGRDTLPVNGSVLAVLKARVRVRSAKTDSVFYNGAENRMDAWDLLRAFYKALETAKIEGFRFHDLRHTFATRLVQAGVDLYAVQKLGRWKTLSMVQRYAHHYPESLRPGIEMLDRVGKRPSTKLAQLAPEARIARLEPVEVVEKFGAPGRN